MHSAADDEREPHEDAEDEDARRRIAAYDLLGKRILAVPRIDDKEADYEEENADRRIDRACEDALHEILHRGVIGGGEDDGAQDLAEADERARRQPRDRAIAAPNLPGDFAEEYFPE